MKIHKKPITASQNALGYRVIENAADTVFDVAKQVRAEMLKATAENKEYLSLALQELESAASSLHDTAFEMAQQDPAYQSSQGLDSATRITAGEVSWTDAYQEFLQAVDGVDPTVFDADYESATDNAVYDVYRRHQGEPAYEEAYRRWRGYSKVFRKRDIEGCDVLDAGRTCERCGGLLNDMGTCPVCDEGEEDPNGEYDAAMTTL